MKKDDPLIGIVERGLEAPIAAMNPGAFLVEAIPISEKDAITCYTYLRTEACPSSEIHPRMVPWR